MFGSDGCIYGVPHNHSRVLRYDVYNETTSLFRNGLGSDGAKWWECVTGLDGCLYCLPINDSQVHKIDTERKIVVRVGNKLKNTGKYWGGGVMENDSCVCIRFL